MSRTLVLALMVLAAAAGPAQAGNHGHGSHGGRQFRGHHGRFEHRIGKIAAAQPNGFGYDNPRHGADRRSGHHPPPV